ncbi:PREDICTED: protein unc-50 homolog isoform X1 [Lupinus angustifolius]|uniref:protein unc-50 homolog isoform X1 n=1 Tax=Lupinus angustifolius TaxID=3871 RepID=UPI00092E838C|nr:PREDICTED: protein unc-50 homolog isoform X1 [Lupinus angustifolius]
MLPTTSKQRPSSSSRPNPTWLPYLRRIIKWQQMDIEYTFWQMLHLCTSPKVVYQHTKYHKQTKNQWARDDPAFVVICSLLLTVATLAYCAAYDHSTAHALFVVFSVLLFHFLLTGVFLATFCWFLTNAYLREEAPNSYVVEQRVEWMYAFDVHCNSFFPMFVLLYVIHYFLSPLLVAHGFVPELLSNLLFMVGASYYHYLNFLGYDECFLSLMCRSDLPVLPFLERTTFFLYPIGVVMVLSPILILSGFNPSRYLMSIYFSRQI